MTASNGDTKYYGCLEDADAVPLGMEPISKFTRYQLRNLMDEIDYVVHKVLPSDNAENDQLLVLLQHRKPVDAKNFGSFDYDIIIQADVEGNLNMRLTSSCSSVRDIYVRASPAIFQEVLEIAKYGKHKTDISQKVRENQRDILEAFELTIKENKEDYFIQEYKIKEEDGTICTENNGYKTNTLKKILKILARITHRKSIKVNPFLKEMIKLPPISSYLHSLTRVLHHDIPLFPNIMEIRVEVKDPKKIALLEDSAVTLSYEKTEVPINELVELFMFVEKNIDYNYIFRDGPSTNSKLYFSIRHQADTSKRLTFSDKKVFDKITEIIDKYYFKK
jgi:hypothetical protein